MMCLHLLSSCRNVVYIRKMMSRYAKNVYGVDKYVEVETTVRIMKCRLCFVLKSSHPIPSCRLFLRPTSRTRSSVSPAVASVVKTTTVSTPRWGRAT